MPTTVDKSAEEAEKLTAGLEKLLKELEDSIKALGKEPDAKELKSLQDLKKKWDELSSKSIKHQSKWKAEKGKDEKEFAKFTKFVNSQVVAGRNMEAKIDKLEEQVASDGDDAARAQKALAQAEAYYKDEVAGRLKQAEDAVVNMQHALVREFPKAASAAYRIAMNALTNEIRESLTKPGFKKTLEEFAQKNKVKLADLENDALVKGRPTNNALVKQRLQNFFSGLEKNYDVLEKALEHQHEEMLEQEKEKEKAAASTDGRASKEYTGNLNKLLKSYKDQLKEQQKTVATFRDTADELKKYAGLIKRAGDTDETTSLADKAVNAAEGLFTGERRFQKEWDDAFSDASMKRRYAKYQIIAGDIKELFVPLHTKAKKVNEQADGARKEAKGELGNVVIALKEHLAALEKKPAADADASEKARNIAAMNKAIRAVDTTLKTAG